MGEMPVRFFTRRDQHIAWHRDAAHLWAPVRTIGPRRHAVGSVMENVDNLAEPAGRLSQSTTLRGCYVPALVKGSMAWLLCLPVGQALPLASSYRSTLFFFRRGTNGSNPFPSASQPSRAAVESDENLASATLFPGLAHEVL